MSDPITTEMDVAPSYARDFSKSVGRDDDSANKGNVSKITIDLGKSVNAVALCAAFCGICMAITVGTVWHSKDREVSTEAQLRKTQNHEDELVAQVKRLSDRLEDSHVPNR